MAIVNTKGITAKLITDPNSVQVLTTFSESDVVTAMMRGLAEYLSEQTIESGGAQFKFVETYYEQPEPEDTAKWPSCLVASTGDVIYDARTLGGPSLLDAAQPDPANPNRRVAEISEAMDTLQVVIRGNTPNEIRQLMHMVEIAMSPVDWIYGALVVLPFYHSQRCVYALESSQIINNGMDAQRRNRMAVMKISARLMQLRVFDMPMAVVHQDVTVTQPPDAIIVTGAAMYRPEDGGVVCGINIVNPN